jgi:hypothetical protein
MFREPARPCRGLLACWQEASGRQRSKTFKTKREASAHLAEVDTALHRGVYISPDAARVRFDQFTEKWLAGRVLPAALDGPAALRCLSPRGPDDDQADEDDDAA